MRVEPDAWTRKPFGDTQAIPYEGHFSSADYNRLKTGLLPAAMEDKWFIYFEGRSLFLHRSWTGQAVYRATFEPDSNGARVLEAVCASEILAASNAEHQSRLLGFLISNLLLGRAEPFPQPEGLVEPAPGIFQHVVSGTGYPKMMAKQGRRWWRFWVQRHLPQGSSGSPEPDDRPG